MPKLPPLPRKASVPMSVTCEGPTVDGWTIISIDEALARKAVGTRCIERKAPVRAHIAADNGMAAHFEHLERNPKCSRSDRPSVSVSRVPRLRA
jgi:hypothetical protein